MLICARVLFQVHEIPLPLVRATCAAAVEFFALPTAAKQEIDYARSPAFRGYMRSGVENTAGRPDLREQAPPGRRHTCSTGRVITVTPRVT